MKHSKDSIPFFQEQVLASSEYFDQWLYKSVGHVAMGKGEPVNKKIFNDLYEVFSDYHQSQKGKENETAHNWIGCDFEEGARNISMFLKHHKTTDSELYFITLYCLLFCIQGESIVAIYKDLGFITDSTDWSVFPELQRIKHWANFFKFPRHDMLLHHTRFFFEGDPSLSNFMIKGVVDDTFIHGFHSVDEAYKVSRTALENKDSFIIIFPNLLSLTKILCTQFEDIITLIVNKPKGMGD